MMIDTDELITTDQLCEAAGIRRNLLYQWVFRGKVRPFLTVGETVSLWTKRQIMEVIQLKSESRTGRPKKEISC